MLSFQDCLDMADVTEGEIDAISKHNGIPPMVALELGHRLLQTAEGRRTLRDIITEDVVSAQARNHCDHCARFSRTLARFLENYPECDEAGMSPAIELEELAAIGEAQEREERESKRHSPNRVLQELKDAKVRSDCRACAKLSLRLIRAASSHD